MHIRRENPVAGCGVEVKMRVMGASQEVGDTTVHTLVRSGLNQGSVFEKESGGPKRCFPVDYR